MADPPWPIKWQGGKTMGLHNLEYPTLSVAEIAEFPVKNLADNDCILILWVTNQFLPDGMALTRL
jgi:N6-adenosine-specific RNA methylase IME4